MAEEDTDKANKLLSLCFKGDLTALQKLLPIQKKPNARLSQAQFISRLHSDTTLLSTASTFGHVAMVRYLIQLNCDLNTREKYGGTALTAAAENGHCDVMKVLIESKANLNSQDNGGMTALMRAAWKDKPECVQLLIAEGADLKLQTPSVGLGCLSHLPILMVHLFSVVVDPGLDSDLLRRP
jgi:ankyrin repeat protein